MYLALSAHIKQLDNLAGVKFNIPVSLLMDNAGKSVFDAIKEDMDLSSYAIFVGKGNNGGDGLKLAKYLKNDGKSVAVYLACEVSQFNENVLDAYNEISKMDIEIKKYTDDVCEDAVLVDALLGISIKDAPYGDIKNAIDRINNLDNKVISIDIPSGVNADTGKIPGSVVKADYT